MKFKSITELQVCYLAYHELLNRINFYKQAMEEKPSNTMLKNMYVNLKAQADEINDYIIKLESK